MSIEERVFRARDQGRAEVKRLQVELDDKRRLLRFLEREVIGAEAGPPRTPRKKRRHGQLTVKQGVLQALAEAGEPLSTPEIRAALDRLGVKAQPVSIYGMISQLAKSGAIVAKPHPGRGNAYVAS